MPQSYFVLPHAPFVVLAFLGTAAAVFGLVAVGAILYLFRKRRRLAFASLLSAFVLAGGYSAALLALAATSRDQVVPRGGRKYFCEIDCHVAYSIDAVTRADVVGPPPRVRAAGTFQVVTLRTFFDPETISSVRGDALLTPNPRAVWVLDEQGRRYPESQAAERALDAVSGPTSPLSKPLRPGESYTTRLVFDLPRNVGRARLLVADAPGVEVLLLGHENSPFHGKVTFALEPDNGSGRR